MTTTLMERCIPKIRRRGIEVVDHCGEPVALVLRQLEGDEVQGQPGGTPGRVQRRAGHRRCPWALVALGSVKLSSPLLRRGKDLV
ncbi:hypothetical protein ACL02T_19585 [Pseudonocardia sp. RS010]|uniref:hypothetical protein n=1 Tax=Pseudonocardia sp. RS010 TaxID=3385979 RepID=UPI0039A32254